MILYAESSAILSWLFGEARGKGIAQLLRKAEGVVASELTLIECERVLIRGWSLGLYTEVQRDELSIRLTRTAQHWTRIAVGEPLLERARRPFPIEPIRTLDALHLVGALLARSEIPELHLLTLDQRIRENGMRLGFRVVPEVG